MSVIYHEGVINDGHYTALVKGFDKKFYYYNDEEVRFHIVNVALSCAQLWVLQFLFLFVTMKAQ